MSNKQLNLSKFSTTYQVSYLKESNIQEIYDLLTNNTTFFKHYPCPCNHQTILNDLSKLPPHTTMNDKYYVGYYKDNKLIAILDLITNYPNNTYCFIGLFMIDLKLQGKGIGTNIINDLSTYLKQVGYSYIKLAIATTNTQANAFWKSLNFIPTGIELKDEYATIAIADKAL